MIYVFYGNDYEKVGKKYGQFFDGFLKKNPSAEVFYFNDENFDFGRAEELSGSAGLFGSARVGVFRRCLKNEMSRDFLSSLLEKFSSSENIFIFVEDKLTKDLEDKLKKAGAKIEMVSGEAEKSGEFNRFSLPDALGRRDKKEAWVLLQKARGAGISPEEIHGMIFWQFKNIALAKEYGARIPGVAPYPAQRAAAHGKRFTAKEIREKLGEIVRIYHDSRLGGAELDLAVEKFVLEI